MTTPLNQLKELAIRKHWKLRTIPGIRAFVHPDDEEILQAIDDSHYQQCIVHLPYDVLIQLHLSWYASTWNDTGSLLGEKAVAFAGRFHTKEWCIILGEI